MNCAVCCPLFNNVALCIENLKLCANDVSATLVRARLGVLGNFNVSLCISHEDNDLALISLRNIKINVTCEIVTGSWNYLMHCVALSCEEFGVVDDMRLICRYPFVDYISVCINYLNLCAGKLIFAGQSLFRQLHDNRSILHIYYVDLSVK